MPFDCLLNVSSTFKPVIAVVNFAALDRPEVAEGRC